MKLREVRIKNFRNLVDVTVPIMDTTVLIGENNSGKTAFLDALRFVLTKGSVRKSQFDEYDFYMETKTDSPETSPGIEIILWFKEDELGDWSDPLIRAINDFSQMEPQTGLNSVGIRFSCKYDDAIQSTVPKWEFLSQDEQPLPGRISSFTNIATFLLYVKLFYLSALRDYENEFSPRSQFWGRIIKDLKITPEQQIQLAEDLERLNGELLNADPRMEEVRQSLENVQNILGSTTGHTTSIQALPLKPWELLTKSTVVVKQRGNDVEFPLAKYGQGMQSMAVIFLFQAYINVLLKPTFETETKAILELEEPEAHLHPHAVRALATNIGSIDSQKIVTTHSPFFIQEVPLQQIRMFRHNMSSAKVFYVRREFSATVPETPDLIRFCSDHPNKFNYDQSKSRIVVHGVIDEDECRRLLIALSTRPDCHAEIRALMKKSTLYLSDDEIAMIDNYSKRIRGEIYFARAWLLCEGQSEYLLLRYFADLMGSCLDQSGVSIIDFQNNGSPGAFVSLARNFEVPWIMITDGDSEGIKFRTQVTNKGVSEEELDNQFFSLSPAGTDLELFLVTNGFRDDYVNILSESAKTSAPHAREWIIASAKQEKEFIYLNALDEYKVEKPDTSGTQQTIIAGDPDFQKLFDDILAKELRKDKVSNMIALIRELDKREAKAECIPVFFSDIIKKIVEKGAGL